MLFAPTHSSIQSYKPQFKSHLFFTKNLHTNSINLNSTTIPSIKRITTVQFNDSTRTANQPVITLTSFSTTNLPPNPNNSTFPATSSGVSTPLTTSPQIPTFDDIDNKILSKYVIAPLTTKAADLKGL